ncbi:uncharacterized protein TOT_010000139 [Theileria orientalis strain Shintoku]|uniref:Uncharacterized protein n=1 Tax=Theileria orientalis strain Shintoku TaxID=869250 RepID=J7MBX8_THEOR|nr:uncharacterized protein TOT_010000139 [Theileria orientalis strain Shintoku]BAM38672.1 uncharacterized protein TOT_010000139 [Theileria orientalis strain Shintoku]|eukprot:XP_009688973.1 uncharacterized protein TOT_010000139 [Theileria orientalis strain Shintoku]
MKFLTSIYREALPADYESSVTEANAYDLQQILYKHNRVFGSVYKFENFRNVFSSPPVSSESVTFLRFWKGIESLLDKDSRISPSMPDVLQKACFVDDPYVTSMRYFRDEILKNEMSLTKTELIETIKKSQESSELADFWPKVAENTKKMFVEENVSVLGVSYMVYNFFVKKYSLDLESTIDAENEQTSFSSDEFYESKTVTESAVDHDEQKMDFKLDESKFDERNMDFKFDDSIWNYEYKYRKLLFDLETSLPKFYTSYSETKSELSQAKEDLKRVTEANDELKNQFTTEKMELMTTNRSLEEKMNEIKEKNSELNGVLVSRDMEIEELTRRVDELTEKYNSSDSYKFSKELLVYKARCEGLERSNDGLNSRIEELERMIESLDQHREERDIDQEKYELESKNRELLEANELLQSENEELSMENKELVDKNESMEKERKELMEKVKNLEKELEELKKILHQHKEKLSEENKNLQRAVDKLREKMNETSSEREEDSCELVDGEDESVEKLRLDNELLQSELRDSKLFIEDYKIKMEDYKQTIENYKSTIEGYKVKVGEYESDLRSSKETIKDYREMIEKYAETKKNINENSNNRVSSVYNEENEKLLNELKTLKRENEVLESEYMELRRENDIKAEEMANLKKELNKLSEQNKYLENKEQLDKKINDQQLVSQQIEEQKLELHQKQSELDKYKKKLIETEKRLDDIEVQNGNLKEKLNDVIQENINLVAKLELMNLPSPQNATNKLMEMIGKYNDIQSPASYDSETTDYDVSEFRSSRSNRGLVSSKGDVSNNERVSDEKVNTHRTDRTNRTERGQKSKKLETQRTNSTEKTERAERADTHRTDRTSRMESSRAEASRSRQEGRSAAVIRRETGKLKRTESIRDESPAESYYDSLSLSNYEELGISEEPDIIQNAITYISKKLNLK